MRIEYVGPHTLILADCREALTCLEDVHACVTDPPYELGFMGKKWDGTGIANDPEIWKVLHKGLLPGAHVLAFSGSRTYHRMACAIEDAEFEIRDQIMWLYGSGFPKSHDIAKSIDKAARGVPHGGVDPTSPNHGKFKGGCSEDNERGQGFGAGPGQFMSEGGVKSEREYVATAKQWDGWGTALKPAHEPICVARKSFKGTVADNVIANGTGALNIDACRVEHVSEEDRAAATPQGRVTSSSKSGGAPDTEREGRQEFDRPDTSKGRWPANVIHDGSDEVVEGFPDSKSCNSPSKAKPEGKILAGARSQGAIYSGETGSAARFFYCAKASKKDRGEGNNHPTVKPIALMRYLCRLVTPPDGVIVDPFMGSGSTGIAAILEGFTFVGIEQDPAYFEIALKRIREAYETTNVEAVDVSEVVR